MSTTGTGSPERTEVCADAIDRHRPGWPILVAVTVVMAAQVALTLWGALSGYSAPRGWAAGLDIAVAIASCCLIPVLYRHPVPTAVLAAVLAIGSTTAIPVSTVATIHVARTRSTRTAVIVAAAGVAGHVLRGMWRSINGVDLGWWVLLVVAIQMVLYFWGARARVQGQLVASLRDRAERVEAEQRHRIAEARLAERSRIAREMHDVLAHRLSMIATFAGALEFRADADPQQRAHAAGVIRESSHQALEDLREVIWVLRDDLPEGGSREDDQDGRHPQPSLASLSSLVQESCAAGVPVVLRGFDEDAIPATLGRTIYRVVQEGLTNVRKHAPGQPTTVTMDRTDAGWTVEVSNALPDAGAGHTAERTQEIPGAGVGLVGLTERVQLAKGTLSHTRDEGRFVLSASLPWSDDQRGAGSHRR